MEIFSKTHVGKVRSNNQDAFADGILSENCAWSVVCDGMGGAKGGNIASQISVDTAKKLISENFNQDLSHEEIEKLSKLCISDSNTAVFSKAMDEPKLKGMGTTMVLVLIKDKNLYVSHVGDSRAYIYRKGEVAQITEDHSFVQDLVNKGEITKSEAKVHPLRNIITRSVGVHSSVKVDFKILRLKEDDIVMLCSDGLSGYLSKEILIDKIKNNDIENLCDVLIDFALENGGSDNVTVSLIKI